MTQFVDTSWLLWMAAAAALGIVVFGFISSAVSAKKTWDELSERFSTAHYSDERLASMGKTAAGLMTVDDDAIGVVVCATQDGILIKNTRSKCILIGWSDIGSLREIGGLGDKVALEIPRSLGLPITVKLPWTRSFGAKMKGGIGQRS